MIRLCYHLCLFACWIAFLAETPHAPAAIRPVSAQEETNWKRHVVPLPKHMRFEGLMEVPANQVAIRVEADSGPVVEQAIHELTDALGVPVGFKLPENAAFTITFRRGGPEADRLAQLPNADQAYRIIPAVGGTGLRLAARSPVGLYYAAKTLQQLIKARAREGKVLMPLVEVADWPDLRDRGLWGCYSFLHIPWLSDRKAPAPNKPI